MELRYYAMGIFFVLEFSGSTNTFPSTNFFLFFSLPCFYYGVAPFSAYKHTHNPQFLLSL